MLFSGHKPSGVHDEYLRFTDAMLVGQFRDQGIAFSAPRKKNRQGPLKPYGGFETAKLYLAKVCELSSFN